MNFSIVDRFVDRRSGISAKYDVTPKFLPPNNCNPVPGADRTMMVIVTEFADGSWYLEVT